MEFWLDDNGGYFILFNEIVEESWYVGILFVWNVVGCVYVVFG